MALSNSGPVPVHLPRSRAGGNPRERIAAIARDLAEMERCPAEHLERLQADWLRALVRHARETVPFWRERLPAADDLPQGAPLSRLLKRIPLLTRAELRDHQQDLLSAKPGEERVLVFHTSGSTGAPLTVHWSRAANHVTAATQARHHRWHGSDPRAKLLSLRAVPGDPSRQGRIIRTANWYPGRESGELVAADATQPIGLQLDLLVRERPRYLVTYPANARALIAAAAERGVEPELLERIDTFGESLPAELPGLAEQAWGVKLADRYAARETGNLAIQCPDHGGYHVQSENVLVEILDAQDRPARVGEPGRVVVTNLHNTAMPILRYEIGDYAAFGPPCACGRGLPVLERILGRVRNMFVLPGGERVWPRLSTDELARLGPVRQFQLVQKRIDRVEFRLVVDRPLSEAEERQLERMVRARLGAGLSVALVYTDAIPRSAGGKYEDFRCEIGEG